MITAADLGGLWQRDWLRTPGFEDTATRVWWLQGGTGNFVDLRLPADLPPAQSLAEMTLDDHRKWLACEGFAGHIEVADGICTWTREINLGGPRSAPDVGRLDWVDAPRQLLETGVHADYSELWTRPAATVPQSRRFSAPGRQLFVVWSMTDFAFGIGDADVALRADLAAALAAGSVGLPDLTRHYATEYAIGHWRDDVAEVRASTHPLRRAGGLFDRSALATEVLALHHPDATGQLASCLWTAANQR